MSDLFQANEVKTNYSAKDIEVLGALAQHDGTMQAGELEKRLGMKHGTFQTYRRRLIDAGVVSSPRRGEVEVAVPMLADYLKRTARGDG